MHMQKISCDQKYLFHDKCSIAECLVHLEVGKEVQREYSTTILYIF